MAADPKRPDQLTGTLDSTTIDTAADLFLVYDLSAASMKKMLPSEITLMVVAGFTAGQIPQSKIAGLGSAASSATTAFDASGAAASAVTTHAGATDPHGDRAYADSLFTAGSTINSLPQLVAANLDVLDEFIVDDVSATADKYITSQDLINGLLRMSRAGLTALTALTGANLAVDDEFLVGDTSATAAKKMTSAEMMLGLNLQAQGINAQTGTTYTIAAADRGKLVTQSNASAITTTFPQDSADTGIQIGSWGEIMQIGAGQVTCAAGAGATVQPTTKKCRAQWSRLFWQKTAANTYVLSGDLA